MVRNVLTVNVGECGINVGHTVWQQYCVEHNINCGGELKNNGDDGDFRSFFEETEKGKFIARNLMVSLDPDAIDNIKNNSKYCSIFDPDYMIGGYQGSGHIFARGHYSAGKEIIDKVADALRRIWERIDGRGQGFVVNNSVSSGTGSGLTSLILERLAVDFRRRNKTGFHIFGSHDHKSNSVIEAYNEILSVHWLLDHTEISTVFDNAKLYNLCKNYLAKSSKDSDSNDINITYQDMNVLISKIESCYTAGIRFVSELNVSLDEHTNDLVSFPRLHFCIPSLAPLIPNNNNNNNNDNNESITKVLKYQNPKYNKSLVDGFVRLNYTIQDKLLLYDDLMNIVYKFYSDKYNTEKHKYYDVTDTIALCEMTFDCDYFMVDLNPMEFDACQDKCMAVRMQRRGNSSSSPNDDKDNYKLMSAACQYLKENKKVTFVEWCPTGFRSEIIENELTRLPNDFNDNLNCDYNNIFCLQNNTAIMRFFDDKFVKEYDKMFSKRAYVHWYLGQGMEEDEFFDAREDLAFLEKDYLDVLMAQDETEDEDGDDDDDDY